VLLQLASWLLMLYDSNLVIKKEAPPLLLRANGISFAGTPLLGPGREAFSISLPCLASSFQISGFSEKSPVWCKSLFVPRGGSGFWA